ncbi:SAM-dependent methyltransferase [Pollutimonas subterranea]|uniref:SAM-dependent methyltransferase n=1 Tax=Pollutimonas subterranea TaxID=2045210 RepID=A0A2N4U3J2_9BURK|nr:class I SAM-dependent methyltransferase [Pollutimonas subterranea]PLC49598.1 SAM-dependent methyltransferase [Pollutimonas subterranea]
MNALQAGLTARPLQAGSPGGSPEDAALVELGMALKNQGYRYTAVTPATHTLVNKRQGNEWAKSVEDVFGWSRPFRAGVMPAALMTLMREAGVITPHDEGWRCRLRASTIKDSLFFHSAYPTDDTDAVFFGPDTYRFIGAIDQHLTTASGPLRRVADIGCGAGPGAITVALRHPHAEVSAIDINDQALRLTNINAVLGAANNVRPLHSNLLNAADGMFDLIIANPPYMIDPTRRAYRHGGGALGEGLSLAIVDAAVQRLSPQGVLLLYTGVAIEQGIDAFRDTVIQMLRDAGFQWSYREIDPDVFGEELLANPAYSRAERIAAIVLTATRGG